MEITRFNGTMRRSNIRIVQPVDSDNASNSNEDNNGFVNNALRIDLKHLKRHDIEVGAQNNVQQGNNNRNKYNMDVQVRLVEEKKEQQVYCTYNRITFVVIPFYLFLFFYILLLYTLQIPTQRQPLQQNAMFRPIPIAPYVQNIKPLDRNYRRPNSSQEESDLVYYGYLP